MEKYSYAFFDVDETIVSFKTMFSFLEYYFECVDGDFGKESFNIYMKKVEEDWRNNRPREKINYDYYRNFDNKSHIQLCSIAKKWLNIKKYEMGDKFYIAPTLRIIERLQSEGVNIVLVSGSLAVLVELLAKELNVNYVLATHLEQQGDIMQGKIIAPQTIGEGKAIAVKGFMSKYNIDVNMTAAYGDHYSDFPMLSVVQKGFIVSGDLEMKNVARKRGYEVIDL